MSSPSFHFVEGTLPLLISIPHLGTEIPEAQLARMTPVAAQSADTDWHLDQLYQFARSIGASILGARYSRYVVDINRPPDDESLYPGQTKTGLCPVATFRGEALYQPGCEPTDEERASRVVQYWQPYHDKLALEIASLRRQHGAVLLWEAHSIASHLPRLFPGKLPDLNLGTNAGASCDAALLDAVEVSLADCPFSWVANGRFKGGYITRHYGRPEENIHAIQLEMCQSTYMDESFPFAYLPEPANRVGAVVERMVRAALGTMRA